MAPHFPTRQWGEATRRDHHGPARRARSAHGLDERADDEAIPGPRPRSAQSEEVATQMRPHHPEAAVHDEANTDKPDNQTRPLLTPKGLPPSYGKPACDQQRCCGEEDGTVACGGPLET